MREQRKYILPQTLGQEAGMGVERMTTKMTFELYVIRESE